MMRPGTYYVGDLCYVMHPQWREVCDLMFATDGNGTLDGEFNLANGVRFALHGTAYGDGVYEDAEGRKYPVDAGIIGCIRVEDVYDPEWWLEGVHTITFNHPFDLQYYNGLFRFVEYKPNGGINVVLEIETNPEDELEDEVEELDNEEL